MKENEEPRFDLTLSLNELLSADNPAGMLNAAMAAADAVNKDRIAADPEWSTPQWIHLHNIVTAFAVGVLQADCWYVRYQVPENFEAVMNDWCRWVWDHLSEKATAHEIVELSLIEYEALVESFIEANPQCRAWNDLPGGMFTSRYTATAKERSFIDLGALTRNGAIYIRDERRRDAEFDRKHDFTD